MLAVLEVNQLPIEQQSFPGIVTPGQRLSVSSGETLEPNETPSSPRTSVLSPSTLELLDKEFLEMERIFQEHERRAKFSDKDRTLTRRSGTEMVTSMSQESNL